MFIIRLRVYVNVQADIVSSSCAVHVVVISPSRTTWWYMNALTPTNARSPAKSAASASVARTTYEITSQSRVFTVVQFLPRDAYASNIHSAVYAMTCCPSVCPFVTSRCCIERAEWIELISDTAYLVLNDKGIQLSAKIRVLPFGTVSETLNLADFFQRFRQVGTSTVASIIHLVRPSQVYHAERPRLFTTPYPRRAVRLRQLRFVLFCADVLKISMMIMMIMMMIMKTFATAHGCNSLLKSGGLGRDGHLSVRVTRARNPK